MERLRAYKTKLDPTIVQAQFFARCAGIARYVFNWALADRIDAWQERQERVNKFEQKRRFNALKYTECPFVTEVPYTITEQAFENVDLAFRGFFRRVRQGGEKPGFPRFKNRDSRKAFTLRGSVRIGERQIKLPIIGWVRLAESGYLPTQDVKIFSANVSQEASNWYISVQVQEEVDEPVKPMGDVLGVDTGYGVLAVTSDGDRYENPSVLAKYEKKLARLQRELSRRTKGSANRQKTKQKIARLHNKIANIRAHHLHNTSRWIVNKGAKTIALEGFNVREMMQEAATTTGGRKAQRAKRLADAGIGELRRQISYKQEWAGGEYYEAPEDAATNRTCSVCGHIKNNIPLSWDMWTCDSCGTEHDRRLNSARNVVQLARRAAA